MSCRLVIIPLVFAFAMPAAIAAESDAQPAVEDAVSPNGVEEMTPAQLRALTAKLDARNAAKREENAATRRRIEELERRNADLAAKRAEVDAELAELLEQAERLEAARDD